MNYSLFTAGLVARVLFMSIVFAGPTLASSADDVARDFKPVSGVVVMVQGQEIIVDLDAASGIRTGDLISVLAPGKPITHPVTQKVLGHLEEVKAVLKVTRLKTGFSFTRPLGAAAPVQRGDGIRSYYSLPAVFWDYSNSGRPFFEQLQSALPDLKWMDYESAQQTKPVKPGRTAGDSAGAVTFIFSAAGVEVRDPEFALLKSYPTAPAAPKSSGAPEKAPPVVAPLQPAPAGKEPQTVQPIYSKTQTLAGLPEVSLMADFVRQGNRLLMASTNGSRLHIFDTGPGVSLVASAELPRPGRVLALKWWRPAESSPVYLAVTAWVDDSVRSSLWVFEESRLVPKRDGLPDILGSFDIDRDGLPETLLAQEFDRDFFFGQRVREVIGAGGDEFRFAAPKVFLPRQFTVLGSAITDLDGDGQLESIYLRNKILFIYSGSRQRYKSPKEMGGSVSVLTYNSNLSSINAHPSTAVFETSPLCVDIDDNGLPEIILPASERTLVGSFVPSVPDIKRSWIAVVRYQGGRFEMGALGEKLEQPVQGLAVNEQQLLAVTTEAGSITGEGAQSHLLAFSLNR